MVRDQPKLFCFGLGFSAQALADRLRAQGWQIAGTSRNPDRLAQWAAQGIEGHLFSDTVGLARPEILLEVDAIVSSIAPGSGDRVIAAHRDMLGQTRAWLGYLSTTGVYGDARGAWVDETVQRKATSDRGQARILAEDQWQGRGAEIFRLAGIYGPGRNQLGAMRDGTAKRLVKPGQVFSRIHVDDIAQILAAAIAKPDPGAIYNVADDEPAPPQTVITYAANLLGMMPPVQEDFETARHKLSPMAQSFYADNKRIDNRKVKRALGLRLIYPTYRQGLSACLAAESSGRR